MNTKDEHGTEVWVEEQSYLSPQWERSDGTTVNVKDMNDKAPFKKMLRKTKYRVKQASRSPITAVSVALAQIVSAVVLENQILLGVGVAIMSVIAFVDALTLVKMKKHLEDEWL
jgi:ribulose kinase